MDFKNFGGLVVGVVVMVTLFAALLIPIIGSATQTEATLDNSGYYHMTKYGTTTELTIEWDHTDPKKIAVNDTEYTLSLPFNQWVSLVVGDDWYLRYADGNTVQFTQTTNGGLSYVSASTSDGKDLKVVCSGGTATITPYTSGVAGTSTTATYTELYVISGDTGDYVMKKSDESAYMAADTPFVALGSTAINTDGRCILRIDGNIEDGATVTVVASTADTTTISDVEVNSTELSNYVGYSLTTITFTVTADGTDNAATYSYYVVPAKVTLELSYHQSPEINALLGIIPLMVAIGIIVAVAAILFARRE